MSAMTSLVRIRKTPKGDKELVCTRALPAGELALVEAPLFVVPVGRYRWGTYNWDLVERLLEDRSLLQRYARWVLCGTEFLLDSQDLAVEQALMAKHRLSRQRVRSLYMSVTTNNIGVLSAAGRRVQGYGLFELLSRADHSCEPNCLLVRPDDNLPELALKTKRDIRAGEALTWSYFREDEFLPADFISRNLATVNNFRFVCKCPRCERELPASLDGKHNLLAVFDNMIKQHAKELLAQPGGMEGVLSSQPLEVHRRALGQL